MQQTVIKVNPSSSWSWAWPSSVPACLMYFRSLWIAPFNLMHLWFKGVLNINILFNQLDCCRHSMSTRLSLCKLWLPEKYNDNYWGCFLLRKQLIELEIHKLTNNFTDSDTLSSLQNSLGHNRSGQVWTDGEKPGQVGTGRGGPDRKWQIFKCLIFQFKISKCTMSKT